MTAFYMFVTEAVILGFFGLDVFLHIIGYGRLYIWRFSACIDLVLILANVGCLVICRSEKLYSVKLLGSFLLVFSRYEADMREKIDYVVSKRMNRI